MNSWEDHHRSIQKSNKKAINPPLPKITARGIPPAHILNEHFKERIRIDPKKFLK